jgi:protein TonB
MSAAAHGRDNRVLHYAVLVSIILHGVALLAAPMLRDASRRVEVWPGPIAARLVQPPPAPAPAAATPEPAKPEPPAIKPAAKPAPSPKPPPAAKAPPTVPPQPAPPPSQAAIEPAPAPSSAAPAPSAVAEMSATPAARPGAEADVDSIARFRMLIIQEALKYKRYPRAAQENNWVGRVDVRVTFGSDGRRVSIVVVRSSGHEILDQQALDTITNVSVPVPPALRGKEFALEIPVIYNLEDNPSG